MTLPAKVRKWLTVGTGDTVIFEIIDGQLIIKKSSTVENYFNTLPPISPQFKKELENQIVADIMEQKR